MQKKKTNEVTLDAIAGLIEKSSEDMRKYVGGEIQKSSDSTKKDLREFVSGELEKSSESTKKYVRDHVSGEIEKLAVLVVDRFEKVDERFDKVDDRLDKVEGRLDNVEGGIKALNSRMTGLEYGQYEMNKKLDITSTRFEIAKVESKFERRFQKIEAKIGMKQKEK